MYIFFKISHLKNDTVSDFLCLTYLVIANNAAKMQIGTYFFEILISFPLDIFSNGIARSYCSSIFNVLRKPCTSLDNGCTAL